jgi:hypothetical protein
MKRSLRNLTGYTIKALDGPEGKVKDFLFDEERWIIRYLDCDFGNLFKSDRILIPGIFIKDIDWDKKIFRINLSKNNIDSCPGLDDKMPVSREYENELSKYYKLDNYWSAIYTAPAGLAMYYPPRPLVAPKKEVHEKDLDTSLRSFNEVEGYHIKAKDGKIGHIHDILVDDEDWQIVYAIVDTSNWLPWSKKVMIPVNRLEEISYVNRELTIYLDKETIKDAPEFNELLLLSRESEEQITNFYISSLTK